MKCYCSSTITSARTVRGAQATALTAHMTYQSRRPLKRDELSLRMTWIISRSDAVNVTTPTTRRKNLRLDAWFWKRCRDPVHLKVILLFLLSFVNRVSKGPRFFCVYGLHFQSGVIGSDSRWKSRTCDFWIKNKVSIVRVNIGSIFANDYCSLYEPPKSVDLPQGCAFFLSCRFLWYLWVRIGFTASSNFPRAIVVL